MISSFKGVVPVVAMDGDGRSVVDSDFPGMISLSDLVRLIVDLNNLPLVDEDDVVITHNTAN